MAQRPYIVLVAEDKKDALNLVKGLVTHVGHKAIGVSTGQEAIDTLRKSHGMIAAVVADYRMPDRDGDDILRYVRNTLKEKYMPFYFLTGYTDALHTQMLMMQGANGIFYKPNLTGLRDTDIVEHLQKILKDEIDEIGKPILLFKHGGSPNDRTYDTVSLDFTEIGSTEEGAMAKYYVAKQHQGFQVVVNMGSGYRGHLEKIDLLKFGANHPDVRKHFEENIEWCLRYNMNRLVNLMGEENALALTPDMLLGVDSPSLEELLQSERGLVTGPAERHTGIITEVGHPYFPMAPLKDSDKHTFRWAGKLKPSYIIFLKRSSVYRYDPYLGKEEGPEKWKEMQDGNRHLEKVTKAEFLAGVLKTGEVLSKVGQDRQGEHLAETSALRDLRQDVYIVDTAVSEKGLDGYHIADGERMPDATDTEVWQAEAERIIHGRGTGRFSSVITAK